MNNPNLATAIEQGRNKAQACLDHTRSEVVSDWPERASAALETFVQQRIIYDREPLFTAEDAVEYCYAHGLTPAHDDRAWGAVFRAVAKAGIIRKSSLTYQRTKGHCSPAFMWEIVFSGEPDGGSGTTATSEPPSDLFATVKQ